MNTSVGIQKSKSRWLLTSTKKRLRRLALALLKLIATMLPASVAFGVAFKIFEPIAATERGYYGAIGGEIFIAIAIFVVVFQYSRFFIDSLTDRR